MCDEALKIESTDMHNKMKQYGFRTGPTQTDLYSHRRWLEALNFGFK